MITSQIKTIESMQILDSHKVDQNSKLLVFLFKVNIWVELLVNWSLYLIINFSKL